MEVSRLVNVPVASSRDSVSNKTWEVTLTARTPRLEDERMADEAPCHELASRKVNHARDISHCHQSILQTTSSQLSPKAQTRQRREIIIRYPRETCRRYRTKHLQLQRYIPSHDHPTQPSSLLPPPLLLVPRESLTRSRVAIDHQPIRNPLTSLTPQQKTRQQTFVAHLQNLVFRAVQF